MQLGANFEDHSDIDILRVGPGLCPNSATAFAFAHSPRTAARGRLCALRRQDHATAQWCVRRTTPLASRRTLVIAIKEITVWKDGSTANHTYLLDGDRMVAYVRKGTTEPFYFKTPIRGFSRSYRKFVELRGTDNPFTVVIPSQLREVTGSKGHSYWVDDTAHTCTCPGFTFRGACKHITEPV